MAERILVAEDDPTIADSVGYSLRACGYHVDAVDSGELVLASDPGAYDLLLPDIPGTDLTRQLRADAGSDGTRILAITAHADGDTRDLALSAGTDQLMTKPFAMAQLLEQARVLTGDLAS